MTDELDEIISAIDEHENELMRQSLAINKLQGASNDVTQVQ